MDDMESAPPNDHARFNGNGLEKIRNPKHEIRNKHEIQNPNDRNDGVQSAAAAQAVCEPLFWSFEFGTF
jgi:hypothetical protein